MKNNINQTETFGYFPFH